MSDMVKIENLKGMIIEIRGLNVLLDSDVAQIYGVETRDINKAVANNPDKFPDGYVVALSKPEKMELVENFHRFDKLKHSTVNPKAFTEKGLYMLPPYSKVQWQPRQPSQSSKPSPRFANYQEASKSYRPCKTKHSRKH